MCIMEVVKLPVNRFFVERCAFLETTVFSEGIVSSENNTLSESTQPPFPRIRKSGAFFVVFVQQNWDKVFTYRLDEDKLKGAKRMKAREKLVPPA